MVSTRGFAVGSASLFVLAVTAATTGCGGTDAPSGEHVTHYGQPIRGGQVDSGDKNVVGISRFVDSYGGAMLCSGSLIAPNLVLTARHCVADVSAPPGAPEGTVECGYSNFGGAFPGSNFTITTNQSIQAFQNTVKGKKVIVPSESKDACGYDIALIVLASNVPESEATPLIPRLDIEVEPHEAYRAVGYGATDEVGSGAGTRRLREGLSVTCKAYCGWQGTATEWQGDTGICQGDSGGPALDTENRVIGVVSRGGGSVACDNPLYGSVYSWRELIISAAKEAAVDGGYPLALWAGGEPPPKEYGAPCSKENAACPANGICIEDRTFLYCTNPCDLADPSTCPEPHYTCTPSGTDANAGLCTSTDIVDPSASGGSGGSGGGGEGQAPSGLATPSSSDGGCAVVSDRDPVKPVPWAVGALALGAVAIRRRRR
jgi:MYXO-CTERM domain-containing protein